MRCRLIVLDKDEVIDVDVCEELSFDDLLKIYLLEDYIVFDEENGFFVDKNKDIKDYHFHDYKSFYLLKDNKKAD